MIEYSKVVSGLNVHLLLEDRVNVLIDESATGKTFMVSILKDDRAALNVNLICVDYTNFEQASMLISLATKNTLVILDNADIYLDREISKLIRDSEASFLIICKSVRNLAISKAGFYKAEFCNSKLEVKKDTRWNCNE